MKHLRKYHYKLKTHVILKYFCDGIFYGFYHQLVATIDVLKSNRNTVIIFMKWNLIHYMLKSVMKQDKIFCGFILALVRPFKWKLDFHGDDFVGFLWVQNFVWLISILRIWDLCWPWRLAMANNWDVCSIGLMDELLIYTNGKILQDFLRSCWIWKCLIKLVRHIQKS